MAANDAFIVTFRTGSGERWNVWVWPEGGRDGKPTAAVNVRDGQNWYPIEQDGGAVESVETQASLF